MVFCIKPPDDDIEMLASMLRAKCHDGECYEFAIALHEATGLPMVGLWSEGTWRHAGIVLDNRYLDASGIGLLSEFGHEFTDSTEREVREIQPSDLQAVRPINTGSFPTILALAQVIWPDLPWIGTTPQMRMMAFLEELEALSRKHNIWINGQYPTTLPILTGADDARLTYALRPSGVSFSFRYEIK